jgi:phosphonate transport system substrate-binding protein
MATDFDRNRNAMIASGRVKEDSNKIIWTSDPLPNDAIVVPADATPELSSRVQAILTAITVEQAKSLLPNRYTAFVAATHAAYDSIEKAGLAVGKIKAKT